MKPPAQVMQIARAAASGSLHVIARRAAWARRSRDQRAESGELGAGSGAVRDGEVGDISPL